MMCQTCKKNKGIKPGVPWGLFECVECRNKTGYCLICGANRNDCLIGMIVVVKGDLYVENW